MSEEKMNFIDFMEKILGQEYLIKLNNDLQQRIDKAIEYIENNGYFYDCTGEIYYSLDEYEQQDLLEILKGSANNANN